MIKNIHTQRKNNERSRLWYLSNKDLPEFKEKVRLRQINHRQTKPERYLWGRAQARALARGIEFTILPEDIKIPEVCPILKVPFQYGTRYAASLDRVDSSKGYVKNNIQVVSRKANVMKQDATKEELKEFARWALEI